MNSKQKIINFNNEPMFEYDPKSGKAVPLPLKWLSPAVNSAFAANPSNKKSRRMTVLTPLKFTAADFEESPSKAAKLRKVESTSVRKGLFNVPAKAQRSSRLSTNYRHSVSRRSGIAARKIPQKKGNIPELSPLLDMEEVEEELLTKKASLRAYPFKSPSRPNLKFTANSKSAPILKKSNLENHRTPKKLLDIPKIETELMPPKTPDSFLSNDAEFMELEKICHGTSNNYNQSPISSVCNLLEGTMLNSNSKQKKATTHAISDVQTIIHGIKEILENDTNAFGHYNASREENLIKINEILENDKRDYEHLYNFHIQNRNRISDFLNSLTCIQKKIPLLGENNNKENILSPNNRRSIRLLNKSPLASNNSKLIVSPVIAKCGDLRKSTLTKNLVTKSQQYQFQSPRIKKALNMYNSMRSEHTILTTPRIERINESPKSSNSSRDLSRRVQNQCILLQDTPLRK